MESDVRRPRRPAQRVWIDDLTRAATRSGELAGLRDRGLGGATVDLAALEHAVSRSDVYDADIRRAGDDRAPAEVALRLVVEDVQAAADVLRPVYERTAGDDGYVSVGLPPDVLHDTERTVAAAARLWARCDRSNVMVEVPVTAPGVPAIEMLLIEGINVNATLAFSLGQCRQVAAAFVSALEARLPRGGGLGTVTGVVSHPVGRIGAAVDAALGLRLVDAASFEERRTMEELLGEIGVASARLAYRLLRRLHAGPRWERLAAAGARPQRCLWAGISSTTQAAALALPDTILAMPRDAVARLGEVEIAEIPLERELDRAAHRIRTLGLIGIELDELTEELEHDHLRACGRSYRRLLASIQNRLRAGQWDRVAIASEESFPASDAPGWAGHGLGPPPSERAETDEAGRLA